MSLNKFSNEEKGYALKLQVGADVIKCNQLEVISDITADSLDIVGEIKADSMDIVGQIKADSLDIVGDVKADTVTATTSITINGEVVPETFFSEGFMNPIFVTGSGTLTNDNRRYTIQTVGNTRYASLSGAVRFSGVVGGVSGANKICEVQIVAIDGINFPAVGQYITGSVSCILNDAVTDGLYTTSCYAKNNGGNNINITVISFQDFAGANPDRSLVIHFNFDYSALVA